MSSEPAKIFHEVRYPESDDRGRTLCFQYVRYHMEDGGAEDGYRFIYRDPQDRLLSGILYIPKAAQILWLLGQAAEHGWLTTAEQVAHDPAS
jgi:hypothetical protein